MEWCQQGQMQQQVHSNLWKNLCIERFCVFQMVTEMLLNYNSQYANNISQSFWNKMRKHLKFS